MRQQEFDQARIMFPKALKDGRLKEYLGGFPDYYLFNPYAESPTDPDAAFSPIRNLILEDTTLKEQVFAALLALAEDKEYGWIVIHYISELKDLETLKKVKLLTQDFLAAIADGLRKNKDSFILNKRWLGAEYSDGLWGDVRRMNRILAREDGLMVLPEEL